MWIQPIDLRRYDRLIFLFAKYKKPKLYLKLMNCYRLNIFIQLWLNCNLILLTHSLFGMLAIYINPALYFLIRFIHSKINQVNILIMQFLHIYLYPGNWWRFLRYFVVLFHGGCSLNFYIFLFFCKISRAYISKIVPDVMNHCENILWHN